MSAHRIGEVRKMSLEIPFDGVEVVAGGGEVQRAAAERIAGMLRAKSGVEAPVVEDSGYASWNIQPERHAIVVGSLKENRAIEFLYYRWLAFVDHSYPGAGGYVLTTLWEPWGNGRNALVVGASDGAGLDAAVARLEAIVEEGDSGIPGLYEVVYGPSLVREKEEVERWAAHGPTPQGWGYDFSDFGGLSYLPAAGWAYLRSGDRRIAEGFRKGWMELIETPVLRTPESQLHLGLWAPMMMWALAETCPVFSDADRLKIVRFLYDALVSSEGVRNAGLVHYGKTELPRQNHQTFCALGVLFGAVYFERHYNLPETGAWRALVDDLFRIGAYCSKQICDNNSHGWNHSIGDFATYALLTGNTAFFDSGMARLAAERAVGNCTSNGFAATVGDHEWFAIAYPNWFMAQVSFYLRDSGLRFAVDNMAPEIAPANLPLRETLYPSKGMILWRQPYDAGTEARPPADHVGLRVFPLDRLYYDIPRNAPGLYATQPPRVATRETFDILTMRSGWKKTDQYLILDGTGGGSHSYEDANAILTLTQDDRFLLLSADSLYFTAPKYHKSV